MVRKIEQEGKQDKVYPGITPNSDKQTIIRASLFNTNINIDPTQEVRPLSQGEGHNPNPFDWQTVENKRKKKKKKKKNPIQTDFPVNPELVIQNFPVRNILEEEPEIIENMAVAPANPIMNLKAALDNDPNNSFLDKVKKMLQGIPKFNGTSGADGAEHIQRFEVWFSVAQKSTYNVNDYPDEANRPFAQAANERNINFNKVAKLLTFQYSLEGKALTWWIENIDINKVTDIEDVYTQFRQKFSKWGETHFEKLHKWNNYKWNIATTSVAELFQDITKLGTILNMPKNVIVMKLKEVLPETHQYHLAGMDDVDAIENKLREMHVRDVTRAILPQSMGAIASVQSNSSIPYMLSILDQKETTPPVKKVSFEDQQGEFVNQAAKNLENHMSKSFDQVMKMYQSRLDNLQEMNTELIHAVTDMSQGFKKKTFERQDDRGRFRGRSQSPYRSDSRDRSSSRERDKSKMKCDNCKEFGHFFRECPIFKSCYKRLQASLQRENEKNKDSVHLSMDEYKDFQETMKLWKESFPN